MREERVSLVGQADREEIPVIYFISVASFQFPAPKLATEAGPAWERGYIHPNVW